LSGGVFYFEPPCRVWFRMFSEKICMFCEQEVTFLRLDTTRKGPPEGDGQELLSAFALVMSKVFIPSLKGRTKVWGFLDDSPQGVLIKNEFIGTLDSFVSVLTG